MAHTHDRTLLASLGFQDPDRGERRHTLACQYLSDPERGAVLLKLARPEWFAEEPTTADAPTPKAPHLLNSTSEYNIPEQPITHTERSIIRAGADYGEPIRRLRSVQRGCCELAVRRGTFLIGFWDVEYRFELDAFGVEWTWREDPDIYALWLAWKRAKAASSRSLSKRWAMLDEKADKDGAGVFGADEPEPIKPAVERAWMPPAAAVARCRDADTYGHLRVEVKIGRCDASVIARQIETYRTGDTSRMRTVDIAAVSWVMDDGDKQMLRDQGITVVRLGRPFEEWCKARTQQEPAPDVEV